MMCVQGVLANDNSFLMFVLWLQIRYRMGILFEEREKNIAMSLSSVGYMGSSPSEKQGSGLCVCLFCAYMCTLFRTVFLPIFGLLMTNTMRSSFRGC